MQNGKKTKNRIEHWHKIAVYLMIFDLIVAAGSYFLALWLRFDCRYSEIPGEYLEACLKFAPYYAVLSVAVLYAMRLYRSLWRFASFVEFERIALSSLILGVLHTVLITVFFRRMPVTYYLIGITVQGMLTLGVRFSYRFILLERSKAAKMLQKTVACRTMVIGAGAAGQMIIRDLHNAAEVKERVHCIIDDNKNKWGRYIDGVPIVGGRDDILLNVQKYKIEKIFVAIPSATAEQRRDILDICKETGCELKNLPSAYSMISEGITAKSAVDVKVEDLLGRETVRVDMDEIFDFLADKVILVTGGGGSIGSELCRQIAQHQPRQLIVFDVYENNAHAIGLELTDKYPQLDLQILIGSVRDSARMNQVFAKYQPDVVYHAAAHKHVPLMEDSPCESIKNNAVGTYITAQAAMLHGCKRFVLISTDKAVNPTNVMGASKRLCEMIIQTFDQKIRQNRAQDLFLMEDNRPVRQDAASALQCQTEFVAVRFGNVLGSNGSVVPRFKEQIERGGPVTVTHPDIIRYFMTIPEAASLVLQAGTYAQGGEIFVLDMGSPVKIDSLARNLIRLSGLRPDVDIKIAYTGLRPGEKLYEEKLMSEEGLRTTPNRLIHIGSPIQFDQDAFLEQLQDLIDAAFQGCEDRIREKIAGIVTTYRPAGEKNAEEMALAGK